MSIFRKAPSFQPLRWVMSKYFKGIFMKNDKKIETELKAQEIDALADELKNIRMGKYPILTFMGLLFLFGSIGGFTGAGAIISFAFKFSLPVYLL